MSTDVSPGREKNEIKIVVDSAKGSVELEVLKTAKVEEVRAKSVQALSLGNPADYELFFEGKPLQLERTLVSYRIDEGAHLELSRITEKG